MPNVKASEVVPIDGLLVTRSRDGRLWLDCYIDSFKGIDVRKAHADGYPAGCDFAHYGAGFSDGLRVPFGVSLEDIEKMCSGRYRVKGERRLKVHLPTPEPNRDIPRILKCARNGIDRGIWEYSGMEAPKWADALTEPEYQFLLEMIERNKKRASKGT